MDQKERIDELSSKLEAVQKKLEDICLQTRQAELERVALVMMAGLVQRCDDLPKSYASAAFDLAEAFVFERDARKVSDS